MLNKETKTFDYFDHVKDKKFDWKDWNCCIFVDRYIELLTGHKFIPDGITWTDRKTALEAIRGVERNFLYAVNKVCNEHNYERVNYQDMKTGDIVLFKEHLRLLGIFDGTFIKAVGDDGLVRKPKHLTLQAWRVNG